MSREIKKPKNPQLQPIFGDKHDPLIVRVLEAENPEFRNSLRALQREGANLTFQSVRSTPTNLREAVQGLTTANLDLPLLTAQAIVDSGEIISKPKSMTDEDVSKLHEEARGFLSIQSSHSENPELIRVNEILQNDSYAKNYAVRRLTADRTSGEEDELNKVALVAGAAIGLGFLSEMLLPIGIHRLGWQHNPSWVPSVVPNLDQVALGVGLAATGQTDDISGAVLNAKTENGGRKSIKQIFKENPQVGAAVAGAFLTDLLILPRLFESHSLPMAVVQGGVFALTATAGSLAAKFGNIQRNQKHMKELDSEGLIPGKDGQKNALTAQEKRFFGLPWKENQSNTYRNGLFWGLMLSASLSLAFAVTGNLEGQAWSPIVQGLIGPAESLVAIAGAKGLVEWNNTYGINGLRRNHELRSRLRKAKRLNSNN